ncbi:Xylose isomerase domain protein TIM barrel [Delftia sp. RIT313]|nr:Xylose isomerase domain protein TIM barrel [Delftia sp. RIT313]
MRDGHRVLVGEGDRLGNIAQLRALLDRGCSAPVSFEPFAEGITQAADSEALLRQSMDFIRHSLL